VGNENERKKRNSAGHLLYGCRQTDHRLFSLREEVAEDPKEGVGQS